MSQIDQIGKIVKFHRGKSGLSRKQLATLAGVGKSTIFDLENGNMGIGLNTLLKVLNILNIKVRLHSPLMSEIDRQPGNLK
ncbi:MAG: helix-turn-helix transcriptional regulator [Candidatus Euphemobacter frigidus]|nr:helix-turn-helix transcriptional regulator [Candidatus Euphemobacter frigidus]MDP8276406.1 helix-turn-helix transcriptional regulator [Candidatus Euphemobacter frigidus]